MVLYQSSILAVRHITKMPARLTRSWVSIAESYSDRTKCPSADKRMPRQKISSDCWPHSTSGLANRDRKAGASAGTTAATSATAAKNGIIRIGDKLFLFTGHNSFSKTPGNGSQTPWMVQLSLTTNPAAMISAAIGKSVRAQPDHHRSRRPGKPSAAPATNRNCQASGLKYQT